MMKNYTGLTKKIGIDRSFQSEQQTHSEEGRVNNGVFLDRVSKSLLPESRIKLLMVDMDTTTPEGKLELCKLICREQLAEVKKVIKDELF